MAARIKGQGGVHKRLAEAIHGLNAVAARTCCVTAMHQFEVTIGVVLVSNDRMAGTVEHYSERLSASHYRLEPPDQRGQGRLGQSREGREDHPQDKAQTDDTV